MLAYIDYEDEEANYMACGECNSSLKGRSFQSCFWSSIEAEELAKAMHEGETNATVSFLLHLDISLAAAEDVKQDFGNACL